MAAIKKMVSSGLGITFLFEVAGKTEIDSGVLCGYRTSKVFVIKYWLVACHVEMPDGWGTLSRSAAMLVGFVLPINPHSLEEAIRKV